MKNLSIKSMMIFLSIVVVTSCNHKSNLTFEDWDKDNDALIDYKEFEQAFLTNYYNDWNLNDDKYLDDEDLLTSTFNIWDLDDNDRLSEKEWIMGFDYYYGNYVVSAYEVIDEDNDGFISYKEYYDVLDETDFYLEWDLNTDNQIHKKELSTGVFDRWDIDNDGVIDMTEYTAFDNYYIDF